MAQATATLVPDAAPTDTNTNIASGAYTDVDSTVAAADGNLITSVANGWTGSGTASAFSFTLTDVPAAADSITSVKLRVRARLTNVTDDDAAIICDITGTNAPTNTISFNSDSDTTLTNKTTGDIATSASAANINGWSVRVYQALFSQEGGADGIVLELDEIEISVIYNATTSGGEPTSFVTARAGKITSNPQIARKPETQEQWNRFVYELNKLVRNEVSGFEPVLTGFSTDPTSPFCWYHRYGQIVYLEFVFGLGTSNSTTFTLTNLPTALTPNVPQRCLVNGIMQDNSVDKLLGSSALIGANGTIIFYPAANTNGTWTATNNKGFNMPSGQYASIMYMLRNPDKA